MDKSLQELSVLETLEELHAEAIAAGRQDLLAIIKRAKDGDADAREKAWDLWEYKDWMMPADPNHRIARVRSVVIHGWGSVWMYRDESRGLLVACSSREDEPNIEGGTRPANARDVEVAFYDGATDAEIRQIALADRSMQC